MSTLGNIYLAMEKDKSELERVLEIFHKAKQLKYLYDEKNKLVPIDRIEKIGKGVCFDHARYQSSLAKKYKLTSRCFVFLSYIDGKLEYDPNVPGGGHADCFIFADGKWYFPDTVGSRKQLFHIEDKDFEYAIAGSLVLRTQQNQHTNLLVGASSKDITSTVASNMVNYFNKVKDRVVEECYEIPDFYDKKFDGMTYKKLAEYVSTHYSPYVFDDKVLELIRKDSSLDKVWSVYTGVA